MARTTVDLSLVGQVLIRAVALLALAGCSRAGIRPQTQAVAADGPGLAVSLVLDDAEAPQDGWLGFTVELTNTGAEPITVEGWVKQHDSLEITEQGGRLRPLLENIDYESSGREDFFTLRPRESLAVGGHINPGDEYDLAPGEYRMVAIYNNSPLVAAYDRQDLRDLTVTEGLRAWPGTSVRSKEVTFGVTLATGQAEQAWRAGREAQPELGLSACLRTDRAVVSRNGQLGLAVKLLNTGRESITVCRWHPRIDTVRIADAEGNPRRLQRRQGTPPSQRQDFYTLGESVVFRASICPADYRLEPGEYRLTVVYPPTALVVESPERVDLSTTEGLRPWAGGPVRSNEAAFRVE